MRYDGEGRFSGLRGSRCLSQRHRCARNAQLFLANELITIYGFGLCGPGKPHEMVRSGNITYGGSCVINSSGGLISKGHPLGETSLGPVCRAGVTATWMSKQQACGEHICGFAAQSWTWWRCCDHRPQTSRCSEEQVYQ